MKERIEAEIQELMAEKSIGMDQLAKLSQELENTKMTILRIEGAVAVCNKLLKEAEPTPEAINKRNGIPTEITGG